MGEDHVAKASVLIDAPKARVWEALVTPAMIKQYLFGTEAISDWQVGSSIRYKGVWKGEAYEDKGQILELEPGKRFVSTFWSALSGKPDEPQYYNKVTYALEGVDGKTRLTVTQDNNDSPEAAQHSSENWQMVLAGLKKIVEG